MDNYLIVKSGCRHCREAIRVIEWLNMKLPIEFRIKVIDNYMWENFGYDQHKIASKFTNEEFSGYPLLYLQGQIIESCQKILLKQFLYSYFSGDLIIK